MPAPFKYFNPHSRVGSDHGRQKEADRISNFNPHSRVGSDSRNTLTRERKSKFQSTLPRGERHSTTFLISDIFQFQSTLPRGERQYCLPYSDRLFLFQSTLPRGERPKIIVHNVGNVVFQSTLPRGERLCHSKCLPASFIDFNPHSRVGSDGAGRGSRQIYSISIHTPAWGATKDSTVLGHIIRISIHTPAWGATTRDHTVPYNVVIFQSTLPRGERRYPPASVFLVENFNPHSRVGSDKIYLMQIHPVKNFNPHSRVGSDFCVFRQFNQHIIFQSTLPRGERRATKL